MLRSIRAKRPSHSTIVSYLALFIALGTGGAYAADKIGSGDIARNAVKGKHIAPNAVRTSDVAPGSLQLDDFAPGQIPQQSANPSASGPRAYAFVDSVSCAVGAPPQDCQVSQAKGVTKVERVGPLGLYCITAPGIDSQQTAAVISIAGAGAEGKFASLLSGGGIGWGCDANSDFVVSTGWLGEINVLNEAGTDIERVTDNNPSGLNGVSFTIVIP